MNKILFGILMAFAFTAAHAKGNAVSGQAKAKEVCAACHGADGAKPIAPDQPILAGQYPDYLIRSLTNYKNNQRSNPVMKTLANTLSKQEIEDLAAWFASQKSGLHDQR